MTTATVEYSPPLRLAQRSPLEWPVVALGTLGFFLLWLWQSRASDGFLEADACTHYLIARFAFREPYRFVDIWGRPWKTLLYAVPAELYGRTGVRVMSLCLALGCAWLARSFAREMGVRATGSAYVLTLGMPLVFLHSFSELTELPFAFLLALVFWLFLRARWCWAALLAGLLPLGRPEGFGFVLLAALWLAWQRRFKALAFLPVGLVLWSYLGWEAYGRDGNPATWILRHWPYAGESVYQSGSLFQFVALLPALVSPAVMPAFVLGVASCAARGLRRSGTRKDRVALTVLAIPLVVLVAHSLLYYLGKMASNGELRYMLVAAPFWATVTAAGWERLWSLLLTGRADAQSEASRNRVTRVALLASLAAALVPMVMQCWMYVVLPIRMDNAWNTTRFIAHWAQRYGQQHDRPAIMSAHPGVFYFLDRSQNDPALTRDFITSNIAHPPAGTILLYDPIYARFNATRERRVEGLEEIRRAGWIEMPYMTIGGWRVFLSPEPLLSSRR